MLGFSLVIIFLRINSVFEDFLILRVVVLGVGVYVIFIRCFSFFLQCRGKVDARKFKKTFDEKFSPYGIVIKFYKLT